MIIASLSGYAETVQDRLYTRANFLSHIQILEKAAMELVSGYLSLEEAEEETLTRINPWGDSIDPGAVSDAVMFLRSRGFQTNKA